MVYDFHVQDEKVKSESKWKLPTKTDLPGDSMRDVYILSLEVPRRIVRKSGTYCFKG